MTLPRFWWTEPENVALVSNELAGRQVKDAVLFDRGVERQIELFQPLHVAEAGRCNSAGDLATIANQQFVLQGQFQELAMSQAATGRLVQPDLHDSLRPDNRTPWHAYQTARRPSRRHHLRKYSPWSEL